MKTAVIGVGHVGPVKETYPIVIDGRNVFDPSEMVQAGLHDHAVGRA